MKLLWEWWLQIWPNLAASVIALPFAFAWHHRRIKANIERAIAAPPPKTADFAAIDERVKEWGGQ